jgi:hypothetical protein
MLEQQLFTSLKGLSEEVFVQRAYLALLGRPADPSGYRHNLEKLRAAVPREQVWEDLANSEESHAFRAKWLDAAAPPAAATAPVLNGATAVQPKAAPASVQAPPATPAPPPAPAHVRDLLQKEGTAFLQAAYLAILGREADPTGLRHYAQRLASGDTREQVLADLRRDPEGKAFNAAIVGLDELVARAAAPAPAAAPAAAPHAVAHVNDLLVLHGESFLRAAYLAILHREVDPDGLRRYMDVLRSGYSRTHVLKELAASSEARAAPGAVPGLAALVAAYDRAQDGSWGGWYWRAVKGAESDLTPDRERRMLAWACIGR